MAVPETSIHLNDRLVAGKYKVGLAWEIIDVEPIAKAQGMQSASYHEFGFGVFALDPRHDLAAFCSG